MISHGKNVKVFCANANRPFAEGVCRKLWLPLGDCTVTTFADGEVSLTINESVRGSDVFLVQSTCKPVNNNLMELLIMIDACRRASAGRITAVIPYFGYARRTARPRPATRSRPSSWQNLLTVAGADRVLTMDLHAAQIQGFFVSRWTTFTVRRCLPRTTCAASATAARTWSSSRRTSAAWRARALSP